MNKIRLAIKPSTWVQLRQMSPRDKTQLELDWEAVVADCDLWDKEDQERKDLEARQQRERARQQREREARDQIEKWIKRQPECPVHAKQRERETPRPPSSRSTVYQSSWVNPRLAEIEASRQRQREEAEREKAVDQLIAEELGKPKSGWDHRSRQAAYRNKDLWIKLHRDYDMSAVDISKRLNIKYGKVSHHLRNADMDPPIG